MSALPRSRTVAIIKPHALAHRFEIEHRIQEASFEIVKERRMELDTETDPETLYELFGEDAGSFCEGPVWVYVLERPRAVEVWATLMGAADPAAAAPHSLRALFGTDRAQNAVMGSPDTHTAELQIAALFASSPPFPTAELPADDAVDGCYSSVAADGSSVSTDATAFDIVPRTTRAAAPTATAFDIVPRTTRAARNRTQPAFRARPVPRTAAAPDIVPRTTRAAALRAGVPVDKTHVGPRTPPSKEQLQKTFHNVPGHKRSQSIAVASTAAPSITPRMSRAASLRLGLDPPPPPPPRTRSSPAHTFQGVPGHKRRESIVVASAKPPSVSPRSNKSAELRQRGDQGPPLSSMFRGATTPKLPGTARTPSDPSTPLPSPARSASRLSLSTTPSRYAPIAPPANGAAASKQPPRPPRPGSAASLHSSPSITPRTNRSAVLRAAKQEPDNLAAARKKNRVSRVAPSSFKPIAI